MNLEMKNKMLDMFIDSESLTIQELKSIGFTDEDLVELCQSKTVSLTEDGTYILSNSHALIIYSYYLYNKKNLERYRSALQRCLKVDPNNYTAANLLFSEALIENDFEKAFKYFEIMDSSTNEFNMRDHNLWLLLLNYVVDVPEQYIDRLSNMRLDDILIHRKDRRYLDETSLNKIRIAIFYGDFASAIEMMELSEEAKNDKVINKITRNLLYLAKENFYVDSSKDELYYDLVASDDYSKLVEVLGEVEDNRRFTYAEFCLYCLAKDMINMIENNRVPKAKNCDDINLVEAIVKHNYELALQLNRCSAYGENCANNEAVSLMLKKIVDKKDEVKLMMAARKIGSTEFSKFYNDLMKNDISGALEKLNVYLARIGKSEYYNYIFSLIKLSLVEKDRAYVVPMLALSSIDCDDFHFDVSTYIQDFYFSLSAKDYKKAFTYLNIISSSRDVGGTVAIDTTELERTLFDTMREAGINESDLVIDIPTMNAGSKKAERDTCSPDKEVSGDAISSESASGKHKEEPVVSDSVVEKDIGDLSGKYSQLTNVIEGVLAGDNLVLLEPMNDEDTKNVLYLASCVPDIEVSLVDSIGDAGKHVMLRYNGGFSENISGSDLIKAGNFAYYEKRFDDCVDCFEQYVSGRRIPKSFIYARLGLAYRALGTNDGYRNAIDCLTIATSRSKNYCDGDFDFTRIVNQLKEICGYNGISVLDNKRIDTAIGEDVAQYKKNSRG